MAGDNASEMPHKFKIGDIINYRPNTRVRRVPSGKSLITGLRGTQMITRSPFYRKTERLDKGADRRPE